MDGPSTSHPLENQQSDSDEDLLEEVEAFKEVEEKDDVMEEIDHYQSDEDDLPTESNPHQSFTDEGPCTSGTHFVCSNWVLCISVKRLKNLAHQFYLPATILKPGHNDRPHIPPHCVVAFSEAIIQGGASFPLYPFIIEVLDYFNVAHFQFTPNSIRAMVAFYIAFIEADIRKHSVVEFAYYIASKPWPGKKVFGIQASGVPMWRVSGTSLTIWATKRIDISLIIQITLENSGLPVSSKLSSFNFTCFDFY